MLHLSERPRFENRSGTHFGFCSGESSYPIGVPEINFPISNPDPGLMMYIFTQDTNVAFAEMTSSSVAHEKMSGVGQKALRESFHERTGKGMT